MNKFMQEAIKEAKKGLENNVGGPFGAVIVKNGKIISRASNEVTSRNDPTAHAEVLAIRRACEKLGTFDLSGCEIYASSEPCPMCLSAIHWARIHKLNFGASREVAARVGFDDKLMYDFLADKGESSFDIHVIDAKDAEKLFLLWEKKKDKIMY